MIQCTLLWNLCSAGTLKRNLHLHKDFLKIDCFRYLLARQHLVNERDREEFDEVSNRRLTSMAIDIASGLAYLSEKRYVHRDIACRNCLVNSDRVVKLADFGMTRPMAESEYYRFSRKGKQIVQYQNEAYLPHQLINRNAASEMDVA